MRKQAWLNIKETNKELSVFADMVSPAKKVRLDMLLTLKKHPNISVKELSLALKTSYNTVLSWLDIYKRKGVRYFLAGSICCDINLPGLESWVKEHPDATLDEIKKWMKSNIRRKFPDDTLLDYLRKKYRFRRKSRSRLLKNLKIKESIIELQKQMKDATPTKRKLIHLLLLLKKQDIPNVYTLQKLSGVVRPSILRLLSLYKRRGLKNLLADKNKKPFIFNVKESAKELRILKENAPANLKPRLHMLLLMKSGVKLTRGAFSKKLGVSRLSLRKWHTMYEKGGIEKLMEYISSKKLKPQVHEAMKQKLSREEYKADEMLHWLSQTHNIMLEKSVLVRYVHRHFGNIIRRKRFNIPIKERVSKLIRIEENLSVKFKPRIHMLLKLKEDPEITTENLASAIGANPRSVVTWYNKYKEGGLVKLFDNKKDSKYNLFPGSI